MKRTLALNEHTMQALKKLEWDGVDGNRFCAAIDNELFLELTGLNAEFISSLITKTCYCEVSYWREEKNTVEYSYCLSVCYSVDDYVAFNCETEESVNDFMELFTEKEPEKTEEQIKWEQFNDSLAGFIGENDYNEVIEQIKQNHTLFWNSIVEDVVENLSTDDIDNDDLKDEIGRAWAENNTDELKNLFLDNASSYELKEMATDIINDYL